MDYLSYFKKLLEITIQEEASDLDISVNHPPNIRITGQLVPLTREKQVSEKDSEEMAFAIMSENQRKRLLEEREIDFSYSLEGRGRFRVNAFFQRGSISLALRFIPSKIRTIEELNLLRKFHQFSDIVSNAAENYSPNLIATYLYELASEFNLFYQKCPILTADNETKKFRLLITQATANTIKKGLELLGIKTVEKM